jgi:urease accessory protein
VIQRLRAEPGRLAIGVVGGQSTVLAAQAATPQRLLLPRHRGAAAWAYQGSYGGGLLAGDELRLDLELDAGARLVLGTQASTKIYRSDDDRVARQGLNLRAAAGSVLLAIADPVCPFAGSRYAQEWQVELAADASLLLVDACTAGRMARGEAWNLASYLSTTRIQVAGVERVCERVRLDGARSRPWAGMQILASVWLLGPALAQTVAQLLPLTTAPLTPGMLESVSPLPGGCVWRLAGRSVQAVQERIYGVLDELEELAGGRPWRRRA